MHSPSPSSSPSPYRSPRKRSKRESSPRKKARVVDAVPLWVETLQLSCPRAEHLRTAVATTAENAYNAPKSATETAGLTAMGTVASSSSALPIGHSPCSSDPIRVSLREHRADEAGHFFFLSCGLCDSMVVPCENCLQLLDPQQVVSLRSPRSAQPEQPSTTVDVCVCMWCGFHNLVDDALRCRLGLSVPFQHVPRDRVRLLQRCIGRDAYFRSKRQLGCTLRQQKPGQGPVRRHEHRSTPVALNVSNHELSSDYFSASSTSTSSDSWGSAPLSREERLDLIDQQLRDFDDPLVIARDRAVLFQHSIASRATCFTKSQLQMLRSLGTNAMSERVLQRVEHFHCDLPRILQLYDDLASLRYAFVRSQHILRVNDDQLPVSEVADVDPERIVAAIIDGYCQSINMILEERCASFRPLLHDVNLMLLSQYALLKVLSIREENAPCSVLHGLHRDHVDLSSIITELQAVDERRALISCIDLWRAVYQTVSICTLVG